MYLRFEFTKAKLIILTVAFGVLILVGVVYWYSEGSTLYAAHQCDARTHRDDEKIDCWYQILRDRMSSRGIRATMIAFGEIYDRYPAFAQSGCHVHAHRVGDMAYYGLYRRDADLYAIDFPQETAACGYGFFHGFFEHLIQDNPTPEFVTNTCDYLEDKLGERLGDIRQICYHGSGHGFMLARSEEVSVRDWGKARAFVTVPLTQCEALAKPTPRERAECREGVYNVLADWMEDGQYGFELDDANLFKVCDLEKRMEWKAACYYEMAQKITRSAAGDPVILDRLVSKIKDPELRRVAFVVGTTGLMQRLADTDIYEQLIRRCLVLREAQANLCVTSVVSGLFEHGSPQQEYKLARNACALIPDEQKTISDACWELFSSKLRRFYDAERSRSICREIPISRRESCLARVSAS